MPHARIKNIFKRLRSDLAERRALRNQGVSKTGLSSIERFKKAPLKAKIKTIGKVIRRRFKK